MECARLTRYGLLSVTGEHARAFLHAQLTKDIENLPPDRATLAGWCSAKGRLLASLLVIPAAQGFLLQLARDLAPGVARKLSMFVLRAKVRIADVSGVHWSSRSRPAPSLMWRRRSIHPNLSMRRVASIALQLTHRFRRMHRIKMRIFSRYRR